MTYTVSICPGDKPLEIRTHELESAKRIVSEYYPNACYSEMDSAGTLTKVYDKTINGYDYVGNIWRS